MSTINTSVIHSDNLRLATTINDLGEILMRESTLIYNEFVLENLNVMENKGISQREILIILYNNILDKLRKLINI